MDEELSIQKSVWLHDVTIALLENKFRGFQKCVTLTQHDNKQSIMDIEMQRPQVRSTGSSYHMHGYYHAGEEPKPVCEGKLAGLIWNGTYQKLFCRFFKSIKKYAKQLGRAAFL